MGKFMDGFRQHVRSVRKSKGRRGYINSFPWHDGTATKIVVTDVMNPGKPIVTDIIGVVNGQKVGLMFELAGRPIINEIKCPKCGGTAKLNVHWPAFQCTDGKWEQMKHEQY